MAGKDSIPMGRGEMRQRIDALENDIASMRASLEQRDTDIIRTIVEHNVLMAKMIRELSDAAENGLSQSSDPE